MKLAQKVGGMGTIKYIIRKTTFTIKYHLRTRWNSEEFLQSNLATFENTVKHSG